MFDHRQHDAVEHYDFWYIRPHEKPLFQKKNAASKFLYLLFLRWFEKHYQFPQSLEEIPGELIQSGLALFSVSQAEILHILQNERTIRRYKREIKKHFGCKNFNSNNLEFKTLLKNHVLKEKNNEILTRVINEYLKKNHTEIPYTDTLTKIIQETKLKQETTLFDQIEAALSQDHKNYIDSHILINDSKAGLQFLRQDSSSSNKGAIKDEINRLSILANLPILSFDFLSEIHPKQTNIYKRRLFTDTPERTQRRPDAIRYALTIIFCYHRNIQAIDNLTEHLLYFIHQIKKTKDRKQKKFDKAIGQQLSNLDQLYQVAQINRDCPKETIEQAVYPSVSQQTIEQIIRTRSFAKKTKKIIRETVIKRYSNSYRHIIFKILDCLEIHSSDKLLVEALALIKRYRNSRCTHYPIEEVVPLDNLISKKEQKNIILRDDNDNQCVLRKDYECAVFKLLRIKLRHKEAWVENASKYRNPEDDLPKDFAECREKYFNLLGVPLSAEVFTNQLRQKMERYLKTFDSNYPKNDLVSIVKKKGKPWILLTPLKKIEEPRNIQKVKEDVLSQWGMIDLLDVLKEVDLRENFTDCFSTAGNREILDRNTIRKRLLLCLFALGTNTGLKRTAGASRNAVSFEELRHIKKFFVNKDDLRESIDAIVNAIFKMRNPKIWKSVSTACAADSKQFGCYAKNLLTEWSPRHHDSGVMIYWHVNDQYICVYSQLKSCTSSEVAAMLQGITDQDTDMEIESQYVDSHGKSELGFALSYLQQFDLLPRYKTIGNQKLYLPYDKFKVSNIKEITTRGINWPLINDQYDEMVKYAVALKVGSSTADTVIRRFARTNYQHPTFKAFMELGKAVKTIFLCRYLDSLELRQQINAGLNVVENWNSANDFVFYGKSGEITSNYRDDQELSMLSLHLVQNCISYINTLLIEELFQSSNWQSKLAEEDYRALTALFYLNINPYGTFELDLSKRLAIQKAGTIA
jgi:TnpA family transposase